MRANMVVDIDRFYLFESIILHEVRIFALLLSLPTAHTYNSD